MKEYIVKKTVTLNATPATVWAALTDPEKTKKYFFGCKVFSDWKKGHPIVFKGKLFFIIPIEMKGQILDIEPGKLLRYNLKNAKSDSTSTVTDVLTGDHNKTILSITDNVGQGNGAEKRFNRSVKGWDKVLSGLKDLVENR